MKDKEERLLKIMQCCAGTSLGRSMHRNHYWIGLEHENGSQHKMEPTEKPSDVDHLISIGYAEPVTFGFEHPKAIKLTAKGKAYLGAML